MCLCMHLCACVNPARFTVEYSTSVCIVMSVYIVTTNLLCLWSFNWGCLHCFPPRGPVSTTSFGGGGGGGSYKTTAFIHGAFNSELGVDKSEGAGMRSRYLLSLVTPEQWRPKPKGRRLFWIHRRGGLIVAS